MGLKGKEKIGRNPARICTEWGRAGRSAGSSLIVLLPGFVICKEKQLPQ